MLGNERKMKLTEHEAYSLVEHIGVTLSSRIDELKNDLFTRLDKIEARLDTQCDRCRNAPTFRETFKWQWATFGLGFSWIAALTGWFMLHVGVLRK